MAGAAKRQSAESEAVNMIFELMRGGMFPTYYGAARIQLSGQFPPASAPPDFNETETDGLPGTIGKLEEQTKQEIRDIWKAERSRKTSRLGVTSAFLRDETTMLIIIPIFITSFLTWLTVSSKTSYVVVALYIVIPFLTFGFIYHDAKREHKARMGVMSRKTHKLLRQVDANYRNQKQALKRAYAEKRRYESL